MSIPFVPDTGRGNLTLVARGYATLLERGVYRLAANRAAEGDSTPHLPIPTVRKAAAGLLAGLCAAAMVLALTDVEAFRTVELKTYDWRLARTAEPSTARKDIALIEIDEVLAAQSAAACGPLAVAARRARAASSTTSLAASRRSSCTT